MSDSIQTDVVITGGGPVGLATALSLADIGLKSVVLERAPLSAWEDPAFDGREIALTHHSVNILKKLNAWNLIPETAICPLREARVETGKFRHPLTFTTNGRGVDALGWLVSNHEIKRALYTVAARRPEITLIPGAAVTAINQGADHATISHTGGEIKAQLVVGADGRFSETRERCGIGAIVHDFKRVMMVCRMFHTSPHHNIATQWFDEGQTVALLPVNGSASSLVLTLPEEQMRQLLALPRDDFNAAVMQRLGNRLGTMRLVSTQHVYPLKGVYAHRFASRRLALVGDASVGMHPITAHGFNLGLKGQETLADAVAWNLSLSADAGAAAGLRRFEKKHRLATAFLFAGTNGLASLYTHDGAPFKKIRETGIKLADSFPPFKRAVTSLLMDRHAENKKYT